MSNAQSQQYDRLLASLEGLQNDNARLMQKIEELRTFLGVRDSEAGLEERFARLVAQWKSTRGHSSKLQEMALNPSYQQIIGLGEPVVPLLLEEMRERPDQWDWALRAITGADPVPRDAWGRLNEIAAAWVAWGQEKGYLK